jgi:thioesterase domain-containing protein
MTPAEIEAYLHRQIPISAAMGIRVRECDSGGATLSAPLLPNVNHRATVFGGSAASLAILAAWTWLHVMLRVAGHPARLVIQRNTMDYLAPITDAFEARCTAPLYPTKEKFMRSLQRYRKARITLGSVLTCAGVQVGGFSGDYVAVKLDGPE